MIYVMGHTCPDSDAIVSAIALAEFLKLKGIDAKAMKQGDINPETKFILEKFHLDVPETITSVDGKDIAIVDTTELTQLPPDLDKANIKYIVDHHKLGGIKTAAQLYTYIMPVGSSATVLYLMYKNENLRIAKSVAGAMLCAVLSDTVIFKSPTTTEIDKIAVEELSKIAEIDNPIALGMEMFKIKSSIDKDSGESLLHRDFKDFDVNGKKIGIGQIELIDGAMIEPKRADIFDAMNKKLADGYHSIIFLSTDIMKEGSEMFVVSQDIAEIEKVYGVKFVNNSAWCDGMLSRKKQVVPPLMEKL